MFRKKTIICLFIFYSCAAAGTVPVGSPTTKNLYSISRELYGRGYLNRFEYADLDTLPAVTIDSHAPVAAYNNLIREYFTESGQGKLTTGLSLIERNVQTERNFNFLKLFPYVTLNFTDRLSAMVLYRIDGELDNDYRYNGKSWRGIAGFPENATINYSGKSFDARFGIERVSWGFAGYSNLMFSESAMPIPLLGFSLRKGKFDFETITGFLEPLVDQLDAMENDTSFFTGQQRYISAHSLTFRPFTSLSFSIREAVLYGGPGRRLEPLYLFPFIWYHGAQLNSRLDDNTIGSVGFDYRAAGLIWLYGELMIDDYQADKETRGDYEPNQMGYLMGGEFYDLLAARSSLAFEYARVNNWTFNQSRAHNRFINANYPIGFKHGPDNDIFYWKIEKWLSGSVRLSYIRSYKRQGEGRIDTPWSRPWLDVDNYSEPFPSGIVATYRENEVKILVLNKNAIWGNIGLKYSDISNVANIPGSDQNDWEFKIDIGMKIPPFSWGF